MLPRPLRAAVRAARPAVLALACASAAHARPAPAAPAAPPRTGLENVERRVQDFRLANGLEFMVVERHQAPVFSFSTVVNSGSANDQVGTTGIAHMMEHMAFKGTSRVGTSDYAREKPLLDAVEQAWNALLAERRLGARADTVKLARLRQAFADAQTAAHRYVVPNEATQLVEQAGGQNVNAFTAEDITDYFYSLPSNRLELWAALHAGTLVDPVFREFYKERDVVYEERRLRYESSPVGRLFYEFVTSAFNAHPYGFGGIGFPSDLQSFSRTQGEAFFRRNYVAKNITVAVVGDVQLAQVKALADRYFSALSDAPAPPPLDTVEPEQVAERRILMEDPAQPMFFVGWHIPAATDPRYAAFKAAADLLGGGDWARLQKALVKERKIATQVDAFTGLPGEKYPNLFGFLVVPATGQDPLLVEQALYAVLDTAMTVRPFTAAELAGYKVRVRAGKIATAGDNGSLAQALSQAQALYGDWRQFFREQERVMALTPQDLTAALAGAIRRSNRTVAMLQNPPAAAAAQGGR